MSTVFNIERPNVTIDIGDGITELVVSSGGLVPIGDDYAMIAGANLSALRAVTSDVNGEAVYASNDTLDNAQVVGITYTAANAGDTVRVKLSGVIEDNGWNWTKGTVYLGTNGSLTQTAPTGGAIVVHVGRALTATTLQIDIDTIITTV